MTLIRLALLLVVFYLACSEHTLLVPFLLLLLLQILPFIYFQHALARPRPP